MTFFQFQDPAYFGLLLLLPILAWWVGRMGPEAAVRFSSTSLAKTVSSECRSRPGRFIFGLRLLALTAIIVALARPQLGTMNNSIDAEGVDIVVTLDLSGSMAALDLSSEKKLFTRLDVAKSVIKDFVDKREYDRIGIVAFATDAFVVSPLTLNHDWLKKNIERLELGVIQGKTAIGTAIGASANRLRNSESMSRIIILITDGENNAGELTPISAAEVAKTLGIKIYTIATGQKGRVPYAQMNQSGEVIRDSSGQPRPARSAFGRIAYMNSNYDETELREIATITGGRFFSATKDGDMERIYEDINQLEKTEIELRSHASFTELFIWPTLAGLALLLIEQLLRNTRYRRLP